MTITANDIATAYSDAPLGYVTIARSVMKGHPWQYTRVAVIAIDGDTLTYTTDGVWYSTVTRSDLADWRRDGV